ncbi:MAG: glycosyltransferase involved in cell wall biosynthesis [Planctomycetota bacterium]|jgi:glycosyltransferase involved in cell wall biosynthesis
MNEVRIHGDPFADSQPASQLRSFLRLAVGNGVRCALSLTGVPARAPLPGEREIPMTDGVRNWATSTNLPPAEVDLILRAASECVSATAPLVTFCSVSGYQDTLRMAGLEWPDAAAVMVAKLHVTAPELLDRVRGELRWAGTENPPHSLSEGELHRWLQLPVAREPRTFVHVANDPFADGTDLVLDTFVQRFAESGLRLRLILPRAAHGTLTMLRERAGQAAHLVDVVAAEFAPDHVVDAAAIVMPFREFTDGRYLVQALASGRPVCVARFASNANMLEGRGVMHAVGGRNIEHDAEYGAFFAPHPVSLIAQMTAAAAEPSESPTGLRGRNHVIANLTRSRPASPPPAVAPLGEQRPVVVLEAPIFETSSSSELTIATAQALLQRGNVDLRLVATTPFHHDLSWLRERAPELLPHLTRSPGRADLWLSSGWPVRASRPDCRKWAVRVDWEYGSLPHEMTPHVTQDADLTVVHSEAVYRSVTAAGRPMRSVKVVPHGVDSVMHEHAAPSPQIMQFKGNRPAVLFCGGLVWRKGFDVFLQSVLAARSAGQDFVVVVKGVGSGQHYGPYGLGELLDRFQTTPGTPPILRLEENLSREDLASVYTACDVMLHPYRGEGFCMPVLEARSCGLPVIATGGGATDALMEGLGTHKIESSRRPVDIPGAHIARPWVLEPEAKQSGELLTQVLQDLPKESLDALRLAPAMRAAFTWDSAAQSLEAFADEGVRIRGVKATPSEPTVVLPPAPRPSPSHTHEPVGR